MASWGPFKVFLIALIIVNVNAELYLNPSENQWTRIGSSVKLFCKANEKISKCSWQTAYDTMYQFGSEEKESKAESGRLQYYHSKDEKECGLTIENVEQKDVGTWSCHVTTVTDDLGIVAGKGQTTVSIASRPKSVDLDQPYNQGSINVSLAKNEVDSASKPINCRVSNADPKPTFNWYIGDAKLSSDESQTKDIKDDNNTWVQTLFYTPEFSHDNKTLRCVVDHVGMEEADKREASVTLRFTKRDKEILKETITADYDRKATYGAVTTVILVFVACMTIVLCYNKRWFCFRSVPVSDSLDENHDDNDPKKEIIKPSEFTAVELTSLTATDGEGNGKAVADSEKPNGTKSDNEETVREKNISERVASFFRLNRKESSIQTVDNVEVGLNTSKSSANGNSNAVKDAVDSTEEKGDIEKPERDVETSSHETPIRFSKIFNLSLFKRTGQKTMERMEEDDNEIEDNDEKAEVDQNQGADDQGKENVEFEPDTKPATNDDSNVQSTPTNNIELEEGENSPPLSSSPKNTAV